MRNGLSSGHTFAALKHRDFRLFWTGQLISVIGTWMQSMGQSWLVLELTHSPLKLGLISALQFAPMLVLSAFSGVWVDRLRKKRLITVTQTVLMVCAFVLFGLTVTGVVQYWHVAVLALVLGVAQSLDMPARQAYIVELVGREDLMNAIAVNSAMFNGARIVGPAVAGIVVAAIGSAWAFFINALSFVAVIIALRAIRTETDPKPVQTNVLADVVEGFRYSWASPVIGTCLLMMALVSTFTINPQVLIPLLARNVLGRGAQDFGALMSVSGLGALTAALLLARTSGTGQGFSGVNMRLTFLGAAALATAHILISRVPGYAAAFPLIYALGFSQILFTASINANIQCEVADGFRGRVMGLYALVFTGVSPIGALFVGVSATHLGVLRTYALSGALGLASVVGMLCLWRFRKGR